MPFLIFMWALIVILLTSSCSDNTKPEKIVIVGQLVQSRIVVDDIKFEKMCTETICTCTKRSDLYTATEMDCEFFDSIIRGELNYE